MNATTKPTDNLELQMRSVATVLNELARMLRAYGYPEKAKEAQGAAKIALEWRREYRKEQRGKP